MGILGSIGMMGVGIIGILGSLGMMGDRLVGLLAPSVWRVWAVGQK